MAECHAWVRSILVIGFVAVAAWVWWQVLAGGNATTLRTVDTAIAASGGNPRAGREVIRAYGCASCHEIPGIRDAQGKIGPSLSGFKDRATVGGVLANSPDNLARWIENPRAVDPQTAMPNLGVTPEQARDAAAYLYAPSN